MGTLLHLQQPSPYQEVIIGLEDIIHKTVSVRGINCILQLRLGKERRQLYFEALKHLVWCFTQRFIPSFEVELLLWFP